MTSGKPAQTGLVDMANIAFYDGQGGSYTPQPVYDVTLQTIPDLAQFKGVFSEVVVNVTWAQLQPTKDGGLVTTAIDDAITAVTNYNTANGTNLGIKLRVYGGYTAPDWAKNIDGPPLTISGKNSVDPNIFSDQTIGRFWTADYIDEWTKLQNALATKYDSNPVIRGISQSAGASASDEPFVPLVTDAPVSSGSSTTVNQPAQLEAGGYSDAAQALTLRAAIANYAQWSTTPLDYTMNNHYLFDGGTESDDPNFTLAVLQQARNSTRIVQPGNHRLQSPIYTADNFVYGQMTADAALDPAAAPGSFQTASPDGLMQLTSQITDPSTYPDFPITGSYAVWPYAIANGVASHTGNVELWDYSGDVPPFPVINGFLNLTQTQAQDLRTQLAAGTSPATGVPNDGSALGFVAPAFVTGPPGTVAFSGTGAVLLASAAPQASYSVTLTSKNGGTLGVTDVYGDVVSGPAGGTTITLSGPLDRVNTVLASLTDTVASATDVVQISATDSGGDSAQRNIGVLIASSGLSPSPSPSGGPSAFQGNRLLAIGGVLSTFSAPGNLQIGPTGTATTLLAALAPSAYSTATLTVGGTFEVLSGGTARFTGALSAPTVTIDPGGAVAADGTLTATGGSITNDGTIEAMADQTLGLQQLTLASDLTGTGTLTIDPGATLILGNVAALSSQSVQFSPNSIAQFANRGAADGSHATQTAAARYATNPYSPSTLELTAPSNAQNITIGGFTFADRLVLDGLSLTTADLSYDNATQTLSVGGASLTYTLSGDLGDLVPVVVASDSSASTIGFVAPPAGVLPSVSAPKTLAGAAGAAVLVPDVVLRTPLPPTLPSDLTITVTLTATHGTLTVGTDDGFVTPSGNGTSTVTISGALDQIERCLLGLTYKAPAATPGDSISISVADYAGTSAAPATITVSNNAAPLQFDWNGASGAFDVAANWSATPHASPPGGTNVASFGAGTYTVSGDGAVGEILVAGTPTLTGDVVAQGRLGTALDVDGGGALTLAGGALLTAGQQATVGDVGQGLLALMGGALTLTGPSTSNALVLGAQAGGNGTVLNLEQIIAAGTVVVGAAGTGTLALRGVASTLKDGGADIGQSPGSLGSATVNGGEWTNAGQLTVGDAGSGTLAIDGMDNGITGQVTAFNATIGNQAGGQGLVTLDGGEMLVVNDQVQTSTLTVGGAGTGTLTIGNGSEVAIGAAVGKPSNNSTTVYPNTGVLAVGGTAGGQGQVSISGNSALLVYGTATVGGTGSVGAGQLTVGTSADDLALFALMGTLTIDGTGQVGLGGANATLRASAVDVDAGGTMSGAGTLSGIGGGNATTTPASITNDGTIAANGGNLLLYGDIGGSGTLTIGSGATLTVEGAVGSGQTIAFSPHAKLVIADPASFHGTITGFDATDTLEIGGAQATSATWAANHLTIDLPSGALQYDVAGSFTTGFATHTDNLGGSNIQAHPPVVGSGAGDVHMTTFDGLKYDFQALGDFVVTQSIDPAEPWEIQMRTTSLGPYPDTSVTQALGTLVGDHRVTFALGRDALVHVDGVADTTLSEGGTQDLGDGTLTRSSDGSWSVRWNTGDTLTVYDNHGPYRDAPYLDWAVTLGADRAPGSVHGLLGSDTGWDQDFQRPDGTVLAQPLSAQQIRGLYADAWRVAPGASLLDDPQAPALAQLVQAIAASPVAGNATDTPAAQGGAAGSTDFLAANPLNAPR
jgi:T5SS/PEP-CTERM-associated repeat protein